MLLICSTALAACGGRSRDTIVVEVPGPEAGAAGSAGVPGASGGTGGAQRDAALDDAAIDGAAIIDDAAIDSGSAGCSSSGVADRTLELITVAGGCRAAHGDAASPSLSADGRMVFFQSAADDLVSGDVNGADDVFAFDRVSRKLERISVSATGATADSFSFEPTASDDGRHVVFTSMATNLIAGAPEGIRVYVRDRSARTTALLPATYACAYAPQVSSDGNLVVWEVTPNCRGSGPGDVLGAFLFDRAANHAEPVGQRDGSDNYQPAISPNGRWLAWGTRPPRTRGQLTSDLKLLQRSSGALQTLPVGKAFVFATIALSNDAEVVAYANNGQVYRYERVSKKLTWISKDSAGNAGNEPGGEVAISSDGARVVFVSRASNLVAGDTNGVADVFLTALRMSSCTTSGRAICAG